MTVMFKKPQKRYFRPERLIGKYECSWSSQSTPPIDALYRCTTCDADSSISWPLRRTSLTASLPSSSVAMRQTSRLSCHFTSITHSHWSILLISLVAGTSPQVCPGSPCDSAEWCHTGTCSLPEELRPGALM